MKAIIPVAGIGNRLRPHTLSQPKPLLHVAGKPILAHILEPLVGLDLDEVVFVIGFKGGQIRDFVLNNYSFRAAFVQQDELLGLGYAIRLAMGKVSDDSVLVVLGDTIVQCDLRDFVGSGDYAVGIHRVEDPRRFGIVEISDGFVAGLEEKPDDPKTNLALIGLYYFKDPTMLKTQLDALVTSGKTTDGEIQLTDALAGMIQAGVKFQAHEVKHWYDCGKKETVLSTNRYLLKMVPTPPPVEGCAIVPPVHIGTKTRLVNSVLGPYVSVGDGAEVVNSVISDTIVGRDAKVQDAVVDSSILGQRSVVKGKKTVLNLGDYSETRSS